MGRRPRPTLYTDAQRMPAPDDRMRPLLPATRVRLSVSRTPRRNSSPGRCYAVPQPHARRPESLRATDPVRPRKSPSAITDLHCFKFQIGLKMAGKPPTGWALPFPVAVLRSMSSRHAGRGKSGLLRESKRSVQATPSRVRGTVHPDDQRSHFPL